MEGSLLKDVSRNSYKWKIVVRMARVWEFRSADQQELYEVDFVVVDRQGGTMEGMIPNNRLDLFMDRLKEGSVYVIERFNLRDPKRTYRAVDHPLRICFTQRTVLNEVLPQPENIPIFAYTALPFVVLSSRADENVVLSDVVGFITKVSNIMPSSGTARHDKRHVYISDGSEPAVVTLWGEHAHAFDADGLRATSLEEPVVALFVGMTVGHFSGLLAFKGTSATKWYINIPIPEVAAVRESTRALPHQIELEGSPHEQGDPLEATIAELSLLDPSDIMGERYKFSIRVTGIVSTGKEWWYMSCKDCWKKLSRSDTGSYTCSRCPNAAPLPRYRVLVNAVDVSAGHDVDSPFAEFTLFGPRAEAAIGKEALVLIASTRGQADHMPPDLLALVGKEFVVVVTPKDDSLDGDYLYFMVQSIEPLVQPLEVPSTSGVTMTSSSIAPPAASPGGDALAPSSLEATPPPCMESTPSGSFVCSEVTPSSTRKEKRKAGVSTSKDGKSRKRFNMMASFCP